MSLSESLKNYLRKKEFILKDNKLMDYKNNIILDLTKTKQSEVIRSSNHINL